MLGPGQRGRPGDEQPGVAQRARQLGCGLGGLGQAAVHGRHPEDHRRPGSRPVRSPQARSGPHARRYRPAAPARGCPRPGRERGTAAAREPRCPGRSTPRRRPAHRGSWPGRAGAAQRPWAARWCPMCRRSRPAIRERAAGARKVSPEASRSTVTTGQEANAAGASVPGARSRACGSASSMMCVSSRAPARGLTGITGTPARRAPITATQVSRRDSASTATRSRPATAAATAALARASSA